MAAHSLVAEYSLLNFSATPGTSRSHLDRPSPAWGASTSTTNQDRVAQRKLGLLRHAGLFSDDTKSAIIERARTSDDLRQAFSLVHDVYLNSGYIAPEKSGMRLRIFEAMCETATFVAKKDGRVVGVLSVVCDSSDLGLPSDSAFRDELDHLRASGVRLCELTNQAVADEYRKSAVPTELMRCAVAHGVKAGYHQAIATVSPGHNAFYDLMGFRQVGSQRSYSNKIFDPVVALSLDLNWFRHPQHDLSSTEQFVHHFGSKGNPFLSRVGEWALEAQCNFLNPELLARLFVIERNFIAECSASELKCLRRHWGDELFDAVADTWRPQSRESGLSDRLDADDESYSLASEMLAGLTEPLHKLAEAARDGLAQLSSICESGFASGENWLQLRARLGLLDDDEIESPTLN